MTSLLDTSQEEKAVQITDDCESYGVKLFLKVYIFSSDAKRWKNLGLPIVKNGHNLPPLIWIGLTDSPKIRGASGPPVLISIDPVI